MATFWRLWCNPPQESVNIAGVLYKKYIYVLWMSYIHKAISDFQQNCLTLYSVKDTTIILSNIKLFYHSVRLCWLVIILWNPAAVKRM